MKKIVIMGLLLCLLQTMWIAGAAAALPDVQAEKDALLGSGIHMGERPDAAEYFRQGAALAQTKHFSEAIAAYTKALEADARYTDAWFQRGEAYWELKKYELAIADYSDVVANDTTYVQVFFKRAVCFYYTQEYRKAVDDLDVVLSLQPQHGSAYLVQAVCFQKQGQKEQAIAIYKRLLSNVPASQKEAIRVAKDMLKRLDVASNGQF